MTYPVQNIYDYVRVGQPIAVRPLTVTEVVEYLKLDPDLIGDTAFEANVNLLIDTAVTECELYTKRTLRQSRFTGYLDSFWSNKATYEIRKSQLAEIETIIYQLDSVDTTIDSTDYYIAINNSFSHVQSALNKNWPSVNDDVMHSIAITFLAGYTAVDFPPDLKLALLAHVAYLFANTGECNTTAQGSLNPSLPSTTKMLYSQYRIMDLRIGL